jgi:peptidoglycan/xylan/chitin deacetylase (PgdA/CDA1 family)
VECLRRPSRCADPGGIILLHDGETGIRWKDVAATPLIIEELQKRGYRFVTVPELLEMR